MTTPQRYGDAVFSHAHTSEYERLVSLAQAYDPYTRDALPPMRPGDRCLDIGPGAGTITRHLADQVAVGGEVVALDRDPASLAPHPHITPVVGDATAELPPVEGGFDLVHARFVLMHLPEWRDVLGRMMSWVKPGGWIVIGDSLAPLGETSVARGVREMVRVVEQTIGTDTGRAESYPHLLSGAGFTDVRYELTVPTVEAGGPFARFMELSAEQIRGAAGVSADWSVVAEAEDALRRQVMHEAGLPLATTVARRAER